MSAGNPTDRHSMFWHMAHDPYPQSDEGVVEVRKTPYELIDELRAEIAEMRAEQHQHDSDMGLLVQAMAHEIEALWNRLNNVD